MDLILKQPPNSSHSAKAPQTRSHPRIRLQVPVFLRSSDATGTEFIELTKTLNISARGACIASTHLLRHDQTVQLTIPAPSAIYGRPVATPIDPIMAKVRRQEVLGDIRVFGLEFLRPLE